MNNLIFPMIHLNGTGARILTRDYDKAYTGIENAIETFRAIEFNARDYYLIDSTAFDEARQQRREIAQKLEEVRQYLEDHLNHVCNNS